MDTKGRTVKSLIAVSAAMILLLAVFAFPASAAYDDYTVMKPCPGYNSSDALPYGDSTVVLYIITDDEEHWFFLNSNSGDVMTDNQSLFTLYCDYDSPYYEFSMGSYAEIIHVYSRLSNGIPTTEKIGSFSSGLFLWDSDEDFRDVEAVYCTVSPLYLGHDAYSMMQADELNLDGTLYLWGVYQYPSSESMAIDALEYYMNVTNRKLENIEDSLYDIQDSNDEIKTEIQEGNSEVKQEVQEQATNIVNDINNAGEDEESLDTDLSWMDSTINTLQGWADTIDGFADTIESAGDEIEEYIESGSGLVSKFLDIVPGPVLAALAFGLVFIVVKKIVGREG